MALASFCRSYVPQTKTVGYRWWFIVACSARCDWPLPGQVRDDDIVAARSGDGGGRDERGTAHPL